MFFWYKVIYNREYVYLRSFHLLPEKKRRVMDAASKFLRKNEQHHRKLQALWKIKTHSLTIIHKNIGHKGHLQCPASQLFSGSSLQIQVYDKLITNLVVLLHKIQLLLNK